MNDAARIERMTVLAKKLVSMNGGDAADVDGVTVLGSRINVSVTSASAADAVCVAVRTIGSKMRVVVSHHYEADAEFPEECPESWTVVLEEAA